MINHNISKKCELYEKNIIKNIIFKNAFNSYSIKVHPYYFYFKGQ